MKQTILPNGSVVVLKNAKRKLMTIGTTVRDEKTNRMYDYAAVPYPEGYIGPNYMFLFNHEDIESIAFLGFINAEYQAFRANTPSEE